MPQLDISTYLMQIVWLILVFSALYCFVRYFFFPRMSKKIALRNAIVDDAIVKSKTLVLECQKLKSEIAQIMHQAREHSVLLQKEADAKARVMMEEAVAISNDKVKAFLVAESKKLADLEQEIRAQVPSVADDVKNEILHFFQQKNKIS